MLKSYSYIWLSSKVMEGRSEDVEFPKDDMSPPGIPIFGINED